MMTAKKLDEADALHGPYGKSEPISLLCVLCCSPPLFFKSLIATNHTLISNVTVKIRLEFVLTGAGR